MRTAQASFSPTFCWDNAATQRPELLCAASKRARVEQGGSDQASAEGDLLLAAGAL